MIIEGIHPSAIFHNSQYWLVYTPYKDWDSQVENPSLLVSSNCVGWKEICPNPLVTTPNRGHHSDPFLFFDNKFRIIYNHYFVDEIGTEHTIVKMIESENGMEWSKPKAIVGVKEVWVSPCMVEDRLWYIKTGVRKKGESVTPWGLFCEGKEIDVYIPGYYVWHFEVRKTDKYVMLISAYPREKDTLSCKLFLAKSDNGKDWNIDYQPIVDSYKATMAKKHLWYSSLENNQWVIKHKDLEIWN